MTDSSFISLDLVVLGIIAVVAVVMLRSILGRKNGDEESRSRARSLPPKEAQNMARDRAKPAPVGDHGAGLGAMSASIDEFAEPGSPLAQALTEIQLEDSSFDPGSFMTGARAAYEMIVEAFAAGDKKALKPLLSEEVFGNFVGAIDQRNQAKETVEQTFIGITKSEIAKAALTDRIAEITIKFVSELISVTKNADGAVIQGDPNQVFKVTDIWTFSRDTKSSNPNWRVSATASG